MPDPAEIAQAKLDKLLELIAEVLHSETIVQGKDWEKREAVRSYCCDAQSEDLAEFGRWFYEE